MNFEESRLIYLQGVEQIAIGNYKAGIKILEDNLSELDPDILVVVYAEIAKAAVEDNDIVKARQYATLALSIEPELPSARKILGL
ncbi:MAG: hypothetical protein EHM58_01510 [Ignavibacteriae bacterium]|nr:MAG: hypothetical protein EHM58_01510 [Ignavibacteriota bacterium]